MARTLLFLSPFIALGLLAGVLLGGSIELPGGDTHGAWYASRAAGVASYLFLWLSLLGGFLMSSAWFDGYISRARLLAIHQAAAIAGLLLGLGHALVLIPDGWTTFTVRDALLPFAASDDRFLTGIGGLALYVGTIISASFWFRRQLGMPAWRLVHYASFLVYLGALWHGLKLGTDTREPWMLGIYLLTTFALIFGLVVRMTYVRASRVRPAVARGASHG